MMKSLVLAACILALLILRGQALMCYDCHGSCNNPTTCNSSISLGSQPPYERCLVQRVTAKDTGIKTELRRCVYAFQCNTAYLCSKAPQNSTCEIGCCDSDLCNSGSLPLSSKPTQTYEPSGPDLSCYSCSDVKNNSIFKETRSCSERPKHSARCRSENFQSIKDIKQDRCLTLKLQVQEQTGEIKEMVVRNCSDMALCGYSNALWVYAMNQSMHTTVLSAQGSCCSGNLCEPKIDEKPTKGNTNTSSAKTGLLALVMVILISLMT